MLEYKYPIIGISGVAKSGKDTLFKCLQAILLEKNINCYRFALADELKIDLDKFLREKVGISAFTTNPEEKEIIRPLMVSYGKAKRLQSKGKYWTSLLDKKIEDNTLNGNVSVITDIRYAEYNFDELHWLKSYNGILVHVERVLSNGSIVMPPNDEERFNDPILKSSSDYHLKWPTSENNSLISEFVSIQLKDLIESITNKNV